MMSVESVYRKSPPLILLSDCYQCLESAEQNIPVELYKTILDKHGIIVISIKYQDDNAKALVKVVSSIGGELHSHNDQGITLWDVKPRKRQGNEHLARSHQFTEFVPHTDCSYEEVIPEFIALYAIHQDELGGGKNLIFDAHQIVDHLSKKSLELLQREKLKIKIPPEFKKQNEFIYETIIDKRYNIRYRRAIIEEETLSVEIKNALDELDSICDSPDVARSFELRNQQLLLLNNRRYLHARTKIKDVNRHLVRARFFLN